MPDKEPSKRSIPLQRPFVGEAEITAATQAIRRGGLMGNEAASFAAERELRELTGSKYAYLTASCTQALELSLLLLDVSPGDEVILPSFSFVSAANAVLLQGARPVFAEIEEETGNLDLVDTEKRISKNTRAIIPVHYAGVSADMSGLMKLADSQQVKIVEDAAQAIGAKYNGQHLGTFGATGCFSFHETKNVSTGEGGAVLIQDQQLAERTEVLREKGTNRAAFLKGEVDKYTWIDVGSSILLPDLLAAILSSQLHKLPEINLRRKTIWNRYLDGLKRASEKGLIHLPSIPIACESNYHMFFFRVQDSSKRDTILRQLRERGIKAAFHFVPLHSSPYSIKNLGGKPGTLPVTERFASSLIRLPLYPDLTNEECDFVIDSVNEILSKGAK